MNRKSEEQIIKLAFGDMDPEEASRIELEAARDPEAARVLSAYREIRSGLRERSTQIPPDQLSKERLREAILAQGLSPKKNAGLPGWLWMPTMAAVAAFGYVYLKPRPTTLDGPSVVAVNSGDLAPKVDLHVPSAESSIGIGMAPMVAKTTPTTVKESAGTRVASYSSHRRRKRTVVQEPKSDLSGLLAMNAISGEAGMSGGTRPAEVEMKGDATAMAPSKPEETTIVVIDEQKDALTGAQRATEASGSNVIVGG